jgi:hypothetical protein
VDILGVGLKEKSVQPASGSSGERRWGGRSGQEEGWVEVVVAVMLESTLRWAGTRIDSSNVACNTRATHLTKSYRVADPHHVNADPDMTFQLNSDPDPTFYFNADPDPASHQKLMEICHHWSTDPPGLHLSFYCERQEPSTAPFLEPLKLFNADSDSDPAFQNNADPDPQPC